MDEKYEKRITTTMLTTTANNNNNNVQQTKVQHKNVKNYLYVRQW